MVTIKEAEAQTGITKQNIRYYEKMGLLQPERERDSQYRKYSEEDIRRLKQIFLFRKLDMPEKMLEKRYQILRCVSRLIIPFFVFLLVFLPRMLSMISDNLLETVIYFLLLLGMAAYLVFVSILYKNYRA